MDYNQAVATAPPGWRRYRVQDLGRLPHRIRSHELERLPEAEIAAMKAGHEAAGERVVRAMFWTLVYHLDPALWDCLAAVEPIHPDVLAAIDTPRGRVIEAGAGSGRLTRHLARFARELIAIEPSSGLRRLLSRRLPQVRIINAVAEALPVADGWADLTAACGSFGPDPAVLGELKRVTRRGAQVVLISPEEPEWFEANGWVRQSFAPISPAAHDPWIDDFFGVPDPPHEVVSLRVGDP